MTNDQRPTTNDQRPTTNKYISPIIFSLLLLLLLNPYKVYATDPTLENPMETIRVSGLKLSGQVRNDWVVTCRGSECISAGDSVADLVHEMLLKDTLEFGEMEAAEQEFCTTLSNLAPSGCTTFSSPYTSPYLGIGPATWSFPALTNGCGAGGALETTLVFLATGINGFSGNLNEPLTGISFLSACNSHDMCYATQGGQANCDDKLYKDLEQICGNYSNQGGCMTFAHTYRAAVGQDGDEAYSDARLAKQCKNFKEDYIKNCSSSNDPV